MHSLSLSNIIIVAKLLWFRENIDESKKFYTSSEMTELVKLYVRTTSPNFSSFHHAFLP